MFYHFIYKNGQEIIEYVLWSTVGTPQIGHILNKNDAIVTFCKVGTWCRSKNLSIWNIYFIGSSPSNFLILTLGKWVPLENHPWSSSLLESNPPRICLLMECCSKWILYLFSWVPWAKLSLLGSLFSRALLAREKIPCQQEEVGWWWVPFRLVLVCCSHVTQDFVVLILSQNGFPIQIEDFHCFPKGDLRCSP